MKSRRLPLLFSGLLYCISLFCPPFVLKEGDSGFIPGFVCLLFGWGTANVAWYANPLYFASLMAFKFMKKTYIPALFSAAAFAIGLTALRIKELPRNEAGHMTAVVGHSVGFYLWLLSMLVILLVALTDILSPETPREIDVPTADETLE